MSVDETKLREWLDETLSRELGLRKRAVDPNSYGAGNYDGAIETLRQLELLLQGVDFE